MSDESLRQLLNTILVISNSFHNPAVVPSAPMIPHHGRSGRPKYDLPYDQLVYFLEHGFTCSKISKMMGASERTIRSLGTNVLLKNVITEGHEAFPNAEYRFIHGWLKQKGLKVKEHRIRQLIRQIDPIGVTNRFFFRSINWRTYSVPGSRALWHLDGHHKLIRYEIRIVKTHQLPRG